MEKIDWEYLKVCSSALGEDNDCSVKALAVLAQISYTEALFIMMEKGRRHRRGVHLTMLLAALNDLGLKNTNIRPPRKSSGGGYTTKTINKALKKGKYLIFSKGHVSALVDGEVIDWAKSRRKQVKMVWKIEAMSVEDKQAA